MQENTIEFRTANPNDWVMRITADRRIEVNENIEVTEAAQKVLDAMQYLLPQPRTWIGLTNEELDEIQRSASFTAKGLGKAIEAKLKEKNT